jgi:hypothetical protein
MNTLKEQSAMRINAPSPLVGEGSTAGRSGLAWVRGSLSALPMRRQPLTRLRFAQAPSPKRGEGGMCALDEIA